MGAWLLLAVACKDADTEETAAEAAPEKSAIVIVIDGVRTDEVCGTEPSSLTGVPGDAMAPELWAELAPSGSYSRNALNTGITITAPAHAALLTGHNESYANFSIETGQGPGLYRPLRPTLFEAALARLHASPEEVLMLSNTVLLEGVTRSVDPDPSAVAGATWTLVTNEDAGGTAADGAVLDELRRLIDEGPPRLVMVNLHDVDRAGHYSEPPIYPLRIGEVDAQIGEFWRWVKEEHPEYAENLLLVVTADHGRHREDVVDVEEPWRNHGDACDGCRETPLFVVGGGAPAAEYATQPLALDVTSTVAAHLGVVMPWAEGLPLDGFDGIVRSGEVAVAASGEMVATQVWLDDVTARSEVVVDGEIVSTPGSLGAEAPSVVDASIGRMACWRELSDTGDARPWVPRCLADTGTGWVDVGFPIEKVNPFWHPALVERNGRIWASWTENVNGAAEHREGTVGLGIASWSPTDGWSTMGLSDGYFPTDPAFVANDDVMVGAYGASLPDPVGRYTRRVRVVPYVLVEGVAEPSGFTDFARDGVRFELPALAVDGLRVNLAAVVMDEEGVHLEAVASEDGGRTWGEPVRVADTENTPTARLAPAWDGSELVWIAEEGADASVCRATPSWEGGDTAATCTAVGSPRVHSFVVRPGGVTVIRDAGVAEWERAEVDG